jgi:uncharacterized RDD family membrane protein YckC
MTIYRFAGFWRRLVAYMIDGAILWIIFFILMIVVGMAFFTGVMTGNADQWFYSIGEPGRIGAMSFGIWIFSFLMHMAYFTFFHGATGRTPGKMLLGLQVVSAEGHPISFGIAFLRSVGYIISGAVFCLGYIWIGFDKRKQGWHDKIAGTVVIIREPQGSAAGVYIPDSASADPPAQSSMPFAGATGISGQPVAQTQETQTHEEATGAGGQKIP